MNSFSGSTKTAQKQARVLIVDDSSIIRRMLRDILDSSPALNVSGAVGNGQKALDLLANHKFDVVLLDIEMPVMDGLTALPKILEIDPDIKVIVISALTQKGADIGLRALKAGAADVITKPDRTQFNYDVETFTSDLLQRVLAICNVETEATTEREPEPTPSFPKPKDLLSSRNPGPVKRITAAVDRRRQGPPQIIAIGSSTGGPNALYELLGAIQSLGGVKQPIVITQHMPPTFTRMLATHITRNTGLAAEEAFDGQTVEPGQVLVAPGDFHMEFETSNKTICVRLTQSEKEHHCRPSVNPMFRSLADIYHDGVLAVVLTGMGSDGCEGCVSLANAGSRVIAQDESSSVVWGMPKAAIDTGVCTAVVSLEEMGKWIHRAANSRECVADVA